MKQLIKLFLIKNIGYESIGNPHYNMNPRNMKFVHNNRLIKFGDNCFVEKLLIDKDKIYVS